MTRPTPPRLMHAGRRRALLWLLAPLASLMAGPGPAAAAPRSLCFEQISGQAARPDVEQLRLDLNGQQVAGFYRWFPWQKDRRVGSLEGRLRSPGTAQVTYRFMQEGQTSSAPLTIVFNDRSAAIRWDPVAPAKPGQEPLPPSVQLPLRPCGQLKPLQVR